jgi:predicted RecA/RadA family phage recombinase
MPDATPYWDPADTITCHAEVAVTGKRFVTLSGPRVNGLPQVSPAAAGSKIFGVALFDVAAGQAVTVARVGIWPVTAGAALTANNSVTSDANGQAVVVAGAAGTVQHAAGAAVDDAAAGGDAVIELRPHSVTV